jgi:hypothetical protein
MHVLAFLLTVGFLVLLPLAGVWITDAPLARYTEFPPQTRYVAPAPFSWVVFAGVAAGALALLVPLAVTLRREWRRRPLAARPVARFPAWGWFGVALAALAWVLAWNRFPWAAALQPFIFSPLWFGFIVVVNALAHRQNGHCMMTAEPRLFLALFPASAAFWWYFEYLNRFVQNWHYVGIDALSPTQYFWMATLPFATVLPAVLGTHAWLDGVFRRPPSADAAPAPARIPPGIATVLLAGAFVGLALLVVWPNILFPLLWLAPLCILVGGRLLAGLPPLDGAPGESPARRVALLAAAALLCGFFLGDVERPQPGPLDLQRALCQPLPPLRDAHPRLRGLPPLRPRMRARRRHRAPLVRAQSRRSLRTGQALAAR